MADNRKYAAVKVTTLSQPAALGATSITPTVILDREGNTISTMSTYFGTKGFGVISPGKEKEEHFVFTGISGGALTGVSHVTMTAPYTETSGLTEAHSVGEVVVIYTNSPAFYNDFANKQNDETIAGIYTFTQSPIVPTPTSAETTAAASVAYVNATTTAGGPDAALAVKGITRLSVAPASAASPIAVGDNDPRVPTSGQTALLAAITADATEINKLDGNSAAFDEMVTFFNSTDITASEAEELTNGSETQKHKHPTFFSNPGLTTDGSLTTSTGTKTITVSCGFVPVNFKAIVLLGVAVGELWTSAVSVSLAQQAILIEGEIGGNVTWRRTTQTTSAAPNATAVLSPYSTSETYGSGTPAAPGTGTASATSNTLGLTSVTVSGNDLIFTFTFTKSGSDCGLRYGVHQLSVTNS